MDGAVYVGAMKWSLGSRTEDYLDARARAVGAALGMRDTLVSYGVTWEGRMTAEEVESMYLGLLVGFGDDLCE